MKWYERFRWRGWYLEWFVKDKSRGWIGGAHWPIMLVEDQKNDYIYGDLEDETIRHEKVHFKQQLELLIVGFWFAYGYFHLTRGYKKNPFEIEANKHEGPRTYKWRKRYGWIKFV